MSSEKSDLEISTDNNNEEEEEKPKRGWRMVTAEDDHSTKSVLPGSSATPEWDTWECHLCTYKNVGTQSKCEMCGVPGKKSSLAARPRRNADTRVDWVKRQQEQICQQTKVKPPRVRTSLASNKSTKSNANFRQTKTKARDSKASSSSKVDNPDDEFTDLSDSVDDEEDEDIPSESLNHSPKPKKKRLMTNTDRKARLNNNNNKSKQKVKRRTVEEEEEEENNNLSDSNQSSDATDNLSPSASPQLNRSASESSLNTSHYSSSSTDSPEPTTSTPAARSDSPLKVTPIEVNGNLIKYSPPTSSGRTGLIIDKKRFTQHSVTVNDVTITFTEFATRQNKYIRKKKKRRADVGKTKNNNFGNGKNRSKNETKLNSNGASTTTTTTTTSSVKEN